MLEGIAEKNTASGARREFVGTCGIKVGVAKTTKDANMIVGGVNVVQHVVGSMTVNRVRWMSVQEVGGRVECLGLEMWRHDA